ncbi:RNA exonuclease 1 like protein [Myotis brandtii]|uniref:RNA exonuclease 1 like protein n=1 Tax=Myotis brandtii TaxID=109478 RepID=S7N959_MYOBR|nr:RNA exonuclease 1 like protein [Myotis brandtii]
MRRGLGPRTRLCTTQELCDLLQGADKPPMASASLPQAAQDPAPKSPSIHLSAARDKDATEELKEEKAAYHQSPSKRMGRVVAANTFHKTQGLEPGPGAGLHKTRGRGAVCQEVVLGGKLAAQTFQIVRYILNKDSPPKEDPLQGAALYQRLKEHLLTEAQLKENGYPFPHPRRPGGAVLFTAQEKPPQDASCRLCCRCGTQYLVAPSGRCEHQEKCHYHWGRLRPTPAAGGWQIQYTCCSAPIGSPGCQVAQQHVQDGRQQDLQGFVQTLDKELPPGAHPGIYALDCEMCYTTSGLELTRVSVVDSALRLVYDTFVRPDRDIVDYNTRFSGVTAAHLAHTSTSIRDVQAALLTLFNAHTILIGHGLQSDLLALKLIHSTVLDTSAKSSLPDFPLRR